MKHIRNSVIGLALLSMFLALPATAQNRTYFGGVRNAVDYDYGNVPGSPALVVDSPALSTAGTSTTYTVALGNTVTGDGTTFAPLSVLAPVTIVDANGVDTATPTAVSCATPGIPDSCSFTATFTNAHGKGARVYSGTAGLQEAMNYSYGTSGEVILSPVWTTMGGTNAMISAATVIPGVDIEDQRIGASQQYWTIQPSATTALATGPTLTAATLYQATSCITGAGGATCTWSTNNPYCSVAYVDLLGNVGIGGTGFQPGALTASLTLEITAPPASAGAVGWIPFCGTTQNLLQYALPLTTTATGVSNGVCTLTTLETIIPACAVANATYGQAASNGQFNTLYVATNMLIPQGTSTTSGIWNPVFNAHSTFSYQPSGTLPVTFETNYPAFPTLTATLSTSSINVLGTAPLPPGYLNYIGRTVRISGKIATTATSGITPEMKVLYGAQTNNYGAAGIPTTLCTILPVGTLTTTAINLGFSCTLTTNAASTTATATVQPDGVGIGWGTGVTALSAADSSVSTVGSLGLFEPGQIFIEFVPTAQAASVAQLIDLHIEPLL